MEGLWPILVLWALAALLGGKKKRPAPPPEAGSPMEEERAEFGNELQRALAELKQAEAEAKRRAAVTAAPRVTSETRAVEYLEGRKARGKQAIAPGKRLEVFTPKDKSRERSVRRPVRPLEGADESMSSEIETVAISAEVGGVIDYDSEAELIIARRRRAAEQREHGSEELTAAQLSRRGERVASAIGGAKQHAGFHARLEALPAPAVVVSTATRNPLARFGDGSLRSAIILSEILGRPVGERPRE